MQCVLIISVFALTTADPPVRHWPLTVNDRANDFRNLFLPGNAPVRQGEQFPRNGYSNNFGNAPFARISGVNPQQNQAPPLPVNNIQWIPVIPNNNAYPFLSQPVKNQNDPNLQRALNNYLNIQPNRITNQPYVQQRLAQPGLIQAVGSGLGEKSSISNTAYINGVPPQNQVQYITYTTPESVQNAGVVQQNVQAAVLNMKQAYPHVNNQNSVPALIELDFNPKNPFSPNQGNKAVQQNQITRRTNGQANGFGTVQPVINFDINFNTPYPQNSQAARPIGNQQFSQIPLPPPNPGPKRPLNTLSNLDFDPNHPFQKNYRDDITHEPEIYTNDDPQYDPERLPEFKRLEHEKAPESIHEDPPDVPTRPIYPGQGKWAKPGVKHRPHITPHTTFGILEETKGIPDGYDTFLEGQKLFDFQNNQFGKKSEKDFPPRPPLGGLIPINKPNPPRYQPQNIQEEVEEENEPFVPSRLYAQVRQTEDEKHLPPAADENGKLKELVKDSKTHTIYSEEGYEDLAYDHAGHEKKAENTEGYKKDKKEVVDDKIKNEPAKKHNFHLPDREIKSYSTGDELTEDDFQKLKEEALRLDDEEDDDDNDDNDKNDSEPEATEYDKSIISKVKPPKKVYSARTTDSNKYKVKVDDFVEAKDSSPISAIVKGDGNTEIEISSEVKVIVQPNNTTKSHKYVKIYPKFHKILKNEGDKPIKIEINKNLDVKKATTTEIPFTTVTPTIEEIFTVEIPATTQATTAIPKMSTSSPHKVNKRRRREAYYLPKIEVDTDFIDKINHTLPKGPTKEERIKAKFPFYYDFKKVGIDENSPLRYSEHPKNIPAKNGDGKLAFYIQADKKRECSEVNPVVDPVPDRIKEANEDTEEEETDVAELAEAPRLGELGDKIDCFKSKYFGENPLDNPLFQEESVGPVEPIFKDIQSITKEAPVNPTKKETLPKNLKVKNAKRDLRDQNSSEEETDNSDSDYKDQTDNAENSEEWEAQSDKPTKEIEHNHITEKNPKADAETVDVTNIHALKESQSEVNTLPPAHLITTPKYTIDLKPKHIYDQIELLQYLPLEDLEAITEKSVTQKPKELSDKKRKLNKAKSRIKEKQYYSDKTTEKDVEKTAVTDKSTDSNERPSDDNKIFEKYSLFEEDTEKPIIRKTEIQVEIVDDDEFLNELSKKGTETTLTYEPKEDNKKIKRKKAKSNLDGAPIRAKAEGIYEKRRSRLLNNRGSVTHIESSTETIETLPVPEPLKRRRRLRKRSRFPFIFDINPFIPKIPVARPPYHDPILTPASAYLIEDPEETVFEVFDIPTTENIGEETNVLPKYKSISEVFYKDDIKPDEQLNVFTDVFNHIKNSPYEQDMFNSASEQVAVRVKPDDSKGTKIGYRSSTTAPSNNRNVYKNHQVSDSRHPTRNNDKTKKRRSTTTTKPEFLSNIHKNHKTYDPKNPLGEDLERIKPHHETRHPNKKQTIQTTTIETPPKAPIHEEKTEEEEDDEESTEVMGLVPPDVHGYKTIYNLKRDNSPDTANEGEVGEKKINKFIVPGMKPPPNRRVYNYSDYLTVNHIRPKTSKPKRSRRSAARPAYAEVTRNRDVTESPENKHNDTKKDDDDYVPHRPQNYHYDEATGKIIYDKKPEVQEESEEIEYIEVLDELPSSTTSKPKQSPIFATATPPPQGESYTDFVKLLKSASNYHEIPDPTTTEKGSEPSSTEAAPSTTLKSVSTTPPEFLSILSQVRNDSNYKVIEDKKKTTTTTQHPEEYIEDAADGESQVQPVKNSPGSMGIVNGQMFKLFDITEFMPNVKSYLPKTPVDTSRYQAIQRPTSRHSLSSRYSSEEKDLQNINTNKSPLINPQNERTEEVKVVIPTVASAIKNFRRGISNTATTPTVRTTQSSVTKFNRGQRRRGTTPRTTTTTKGDATAASAELTRNRRMQRRRNSRFQLPTKNTPTEKPVVRASDTPKVIHRRSQRDSSTLSSENKVQILPEQVHSRKTRTQHEPITRQPHKASIEENITDNDTVQVAQKVADIFKNYDKIKRNRGNKKEDQVVASENRLGQIQKNKIGSQNENVAVFKKYDKSKKHGGNYRAENEGAGQIIEKPAAGEVEIFKNYDNTQKHGGNYRREKESGVSKEAIVEGRESEKVNDVETFKDYDKTKKRGGNYKPEDEVQINEPQLDESRLLTPKGNQIETNGRKSKEIETFRDYDKNKKHGGNYVSEDETKEKVSLQDDGDAKEIEVFNNYDTTEKHGGNYRDEHESDIDPKIDESAYDSFDSPVQKRNHENPDHSIIDVVFKPETFYSDPKLPGVINGLKIVDDLSHEELEQIVSSAETESPSDELGYSSENERKDSQNILEHGDADHKRSPQLSTTTKKPLFIKDPSQRLYFYAPLR